MTEKGRGTVRQGKAFRQGRARQGRAGMGRGGQDRERAVHMRVYMPLCTSKRR